MTDEFKELFESGQATEVVDSPAPLHQRKGPSVYLLQQERPLTRNIIELTAKGYKPKEVAERLGVTTSTVNNTLRQPFVNEKMPAEIRRAMGADEEVVEVIKENIAAAVRVLVDIAKDENEKASSRIAAANSLLDRRYGKPNQPINSGTGIDLGTLTDKDLVNMLPSTDSTGNS